MHPDDIARHEIRRPLDALEFTAQDARKSLCEQRLAKAGHSLHEDVAAGQQRHDERPDGGLGTDHDPPELPGKRRFQLLNG